MSVWKLVKLNFGRNPAHFGEVGIGMEKRAIASVPILYLVHGLVSTRGYSVKMQLRNYCRYFLQKSNLN